MRWTKIFWMLLALPFLVGASPTFYTVAPLSDGSGATTTGSITATQNTLVVANVATWSPGMGIAVAGAGSAAAELITTVASISGSTFTLANPAVTTVVAAAIHHDDTAALASAIANNTMLFLPPGFYNVTSTITITTPVHLWGSGWNTVINNRGSTNDVFAFNPPGFQNGGFIRDLAVSQDGGVSPTAGYAFNLAGNASFQLQQFYLERIFSYGMFGVVNVGNYVIDLHVSRLFLQNMQHGIHINSAPPAGDIFWDNIYIQGDGTHFDGVTVVVSDLMEFTNLKMNHTSFTFATSGIGDSRGMRIVNASFEGGGPTCLLDFGTNGAEDVQIIGGRFDLVTTPICNASHAATTAFVGVGLGIAPGVAYITASMPYTVATLPGNASGTIAIKGQREYVTDADSCASRLSAVVHTSGSTFCTVVFNGTTWLQN